MVIQAYVSSYDGEFRLPLVLLEEGVCYDQ